MDYVPSPIRGGYMKWPVHRLGGLGKIDIYPTMMEIKHLSLAVEFDILNGHMQQALTPVANIIHASSIGAFPNSLEYRPGPSYTRCLRWREAVLISA